MLEIFNQYLKGYLCQKPLTKNNNARVEFVSKKKTDVDISNLLVYVVPTQDGELRMEEFGQLLREIFITLMLSLMPKRGICLHSSSVRYKSKALLFIGPSGIGKSSICKLLTKKFTQLTDDATFLAKLGRWVTSPLPIFEKNVPLVQRTSSKKYEVAALFFLKQSKRNSCIRLNSNTEALQLLLDSAIYTGAQYELLSIKSLLKSTIPFYKLSFAKKVSLSNLIEGYLE